MIKIGIIGLGKVGSATVKILEEKKELIQKRIGTQIIIKKICDKDITAPRGLNLPSEILTTDFNEIVEDPEIQLVVELIGGIEPAHTIITESIKKGKNVVTANKAVLANYWNEIFDLANYYKKLVYLEASVGAGIPIIQSLNEGLAANKIISILGILNGTSNYVLTKMDKENKDFSFALKEAQQKGFAEADPSLDVRGIDTQHKLAILGSIAYGTQINLEDIYCEGIEDISLMDINYAQQTFGYRLKLLGIMKQKNNRIEARVHPTFLSSSHPLATIENEDNAIFIEGDIVGKTMFYGKGAGQMSAASAVVSDIIYLSRNIYSQIAGKVPYIICETEKKITIQDISNLETRYYLRFMAKDQPGVLSAISGILGKEEVSISSCFQEGRSLNKSVPIIMVTHRAKEKNVKNALKQIDHLDVIKSPSVLIRIEDEE